jgi:uncharacterized protein with ParB-like and HNH nuclease domain
MGQEAQVTRQGLLDLLKSANGDQFVVPVYQRNYTWRANYEVKQFLVDLDAVINGEYPRHFLGVIIFLSKTIRLGVNEMSIIDGQQRLTTIFLTLYAAKSIYEERGDTDSAAVIESSYLVNSHGPQYRLKPLVADDDVYRCIVENKFDDIDNKESKIYLNYIAIKEHLKSLISNGNSLDDVVMALDKLYLVTIPINENDNAQKIFESINATGSKLTAADLIRNFLLMNLQSDTQDNYYSKYWKKIEDYISADSKKLEMFFRMFLAIKTYTLVSKSNVYRSFVDWVKSTNIDVKELFENLLEYAKVYHAVYVNTTSKINTALKIALTDFRKFDSDLPLPLAMELYELYLQEKIDINNLAKAIDSINAYMIRRSLCDLDSSNIARLFPTILKKVLEKCNGDYSKIVDALNQELVGNNANTSGSYMPTDVQMHEILHNASVYKRPALRIVLDRLETNHNSAPVDLSALSIEHLMPQTPTDEWLEELGVDEETYFANLHRLGNLTLATKPDNSRMSNSVWEYKNEVLKSTSHLKLTTELLPIKRWDLDCIEKRTGSLIDRICELYPYPKVKIVNDSSQTNIVSEKEALEIVSDLLFGDSKFTEVEKNRIYISQDKKDGYVLYTSKMYRQGVKEKYWFGYRLNRLEKIKDAQNKNMVFVCRNDKTLIVKFPKSFMDSILDNLNRSEDEEGNVRHYHIVIFKDNGQFTMLLSRPELKEIDISKYVVAEI